MSIQRKTSPDRCRGAACCSRNEGVKINLTSIIKAMLQIGSLREGAPDEVG